MASEIVSRVAHFPDHDHVRVLAQRPAQRGGKGAGVRMHLALGDVATRRLDDVLDGVFQRDDVIVPLQVDFLDHGSQRRRFAAADGTGDEHETVVILGQLLEARRQPDLVHRPQLRRDDPENDVDP